MKICVTNWMMNGLTGSCLYAYELARALNKEHEVIVASQWDNPDGEGIFLKLNLEDEGIECVERGQVHCDLIIASHKPSLEVIEPSDAPVIFISHSEYVWEEPILHPQIVSYVAIRESIKDRWEPEYDLAPWHIIGNPIDTDRFKPVKKERKPYKLTVVPCTVDELRKSFLTKLINESDSENRLRIVGYDKGAQLPTSEYVERKPATFHIEREMAEADKVAGILLGRVNLEAAAMGIPSVMIDPETLEETDFPPRLPKEYKADYVANEILKCLK